jgi:hypothetical protein
MKNLAKLVVISVFGIGALFTFLSSVDVSGFGSEVSAQAKATPTPANTRANTNTAPAANTVNANANAAKPTPPPAGGKTIPKTFTLDQDGGEGAVPFDHDTHAFKNYSPDGKSVVGCVECHHTDQPKSALKPPLVTSERDVVLTFDSWKASAQKVNECRSCHFLPTDIPEGKEMPTASYTERGKTVKKDLNNELAYHINCNTCHDAAAAARPALKGKPGFATGQDCKTCHSK